VAVALLVAAGAANAGQVSGYDLSGGPILINTCGGITTDLSGSGIVSPGTLLPMNTTGDGSLSTCNGVTTGISRGISDVWAYSDVDSTTQAPLGRQSARAAGSADFGQLRLKAQVDANTAGQAADLGPFFGGATGGWSDHLTITATDPANDGKAGRLFFRLLVDGTLDAVPGVPSEAGLRIQHWLLGGPIGNPYTADYLNLANGFGAGATPHKTVSESVIIGVNFTFGTAFDLGVFATAYVLAPKGAVPASVHPKSDFSNGLVWDGIYAVNLSSTAQPVGYTVMADSGLDYTQSVPLTVPEPEAEALGACALYSVGFVARRRRDERLRVTG
jgi:hypothetical protein